MPYTLDPARLQEQAVTAIARLKGAGVTTVIFAGDPLAPATLTAEATAQDWYPEWMFGNVALVGTTVFARTYDQAHRAHASGVTQNSVGIDPSQTSWNYLHDWCGRPDPHAGELPRRHVRARPRRHRDDPAFISFGSHDLWPGSDYNGIDDLAEIWWDPEAEGPDELNREGTGMYRYVDGGQRYLPGDWPDSPPAMFEREGSVTNLDAPPADEAVPDYPLPERDR